MQHYEIFQKLPFEQVTYVESATSVEDTKNRWNELKQMFFTFAGKPATWHIHLTKKRFTLSTQHAFRREIGC